MTGKFWLLWRESESIGIDKTWPARSCHPELQVGDA